MLLRMSTLVACVAMTGCASVVNGPTQPMKVETRTDAGQIVAGAECTLTNNHGSQSVKSGETLQVRRSGEDLDIVCQHPGNPGATARAVSRASPALLGNIIIGGGIGALVDHANGAGYNYPTWVQLVFGKTLVFDRRAETPGQPVADNQSVAAAGK